MVSRASPHNWPCRYQKLDSALECERNGRFNSPAVLLIPPHAAIAVPLETTVAMSDHDAMLFSCNRDNGLEDERPQAALRS
jgi:hypothetical protein